MLVIFVSSFLCVWNKMTWRNLLTKVLSQDFYTYSIDEWTNSQNLRSCRSISLKVVLIFLKNFPDFSSNTIEKQVIINLSSYGCKSYASVVFCYVKVAFLDEGEMHLSFIFLLCLVETAMHNQVNMLSGFYVFHTSGGISLRPIAFLI